ncbi:hypothetical protein WJX74_009957 [Apatococcus lobatus]|uniref:DNA2/NAM7 helicase-like C-terminal domain-containing protein n=1 Tax=Apatococcus lobatus TaxID=904363 RepID=A0AAW1RJN1_9CHLO
MTPLLRIMEFVGAAWQDLRLTGSKGSLGGAGSMSTFVWCDTTSQQCSQLRVRLPDDLDIEAAVHGDEIACSELHTWASGQRNPSACTVAAGTGHVQLLKWLAAQQSAPQATSVGSAEDQGLSETRSATFAAAFGGHLDVLQWQAARGALTSELLGQVGVLAASQGHSHIGVYMTQKQVLEATESQQMDTTGAAAVDIVDILKWLSCTIGIQPERVFVMAAYTGQIRVLEWCQRKWPSCTLEPGLCEVAAEAGQTGVLRWLRNQCPPCSWDFNVLQARGRLSNLDLAPLVSCAKGVQQQKRAAWPSMAQSGTSSSLKDGVPILEHYQTSSSSPLPAWQTLTSAGHCALEVASVLMDCLG